MKDARSNPPKTVMTEDGEVWSSSTKIDGQRVVIALFYDDTDAEAEWNVALLVGATRKAKKGVRQAAWWGREYGGRSTGRVGLRALKWAMDQIDLFQSEYPDATVVVGWEDDKRRKAYAALTRYGFKLGRYKEKPVYFRTAEDFQARSRTRRNPMSRCPISGKFVARGNPGTPTVTNPDGEEVVFCCPSHKYQYLRENPVKYSEKLEDRILRILAHDYADRATTDIFDGYYGGTKSRRYTHLRIILSKKKSSKDPAEILSPSDQLNLLSEFIAENFDLRRRDIKTIFKRAVRSEGKRLREAAPFRHKLAGGEAMYEADRADSDRAKLAQTYRREKEEWDAKQDHFQNKFLLSLVGRADPMGMTPGAEGLYIHSFNTFPQPTTAEQFRDFMNISGEVCFSTFDDDRTLYVPRKQDAFLAAVVKSTPRLHSTGDVYSLRDYKGQRFPTRVAEDWHAHDEAFVTPHESELRAILVSPNHWHLARIRKAAQELGVVLIIMRAPPYKGLGDDTVEDWEGSDRQLWGRLYSNLYWRSGMGYQSIDLNKYGEMDVDRELPVRKRKYKSRPRRRKPKYRKNPYEYLIPEGLTPKTAGWGAKHAIVPGTQRRLKKAGDIILPEGVVRFVFPKPDGRFRQQDIQPEAGVLKVLVDIGVTGPDKLTPMGLWHRFFQGFNEIAYALPRKRRALLSPGIAADTYDVKIAKLTGGNGSPQPRTRWWRAGNKYLGSEANYDAMAMAMTFPGGIIYGVRPTGFGREALDAEHPPAVKAKLREYLRPIEQRDTDRVRRWVGEQARRGVVTLTSYDLLLRNNDPLAYTTEDYLETGEIPPEYERRLQGISSILEEDYAGHFRPGFGLDPLPRKNPGAVDPQGRYIPEKYLAGLPPELRAARIQELGESRDEYGTGDFSELPTDRAARKMGLVRLSAYRVVAQQRGFDISQVSDMKDMATKALQYYGVKPTASVVNKLAAGLEKVYAKGLAAWKSGGHRPGATGRNWADARVASVLVGGKAAWTADSKQFNMLPPKARQAAINQLPELYEALAAQGRQRDINYIQEASGMTANDNPSWADFKRGLTRAGASAKNTAAYAKKRASLNAKLSKAKKREAKARAELEYLMKCMDRLHLRSDDDLNPFGRDVVRSLLEEVQNTAKATDDAKRELRRFLRARSNPTVGLPPIDSIDRSYYPSVFRDSDGDGFMDVDDPDPLNPSKESIEEVLLSDEIGHLIDERQNYVGAKNKVMDMLRKAGGRRAQVYGRVKSPYSLINKLRRKTMSKLTDVAGTMIVLPSAEEAAHVWSVVRANFPFYEVDGKIDVDDYYARPKPTSGYRAYHAIFDIDGKPVEVQIKTKLMKDLAAHSHHAYKDDNLDTVMSWKLFDAAELADNGDVAHREIIELLLEDPRALSYLFART